MYFVLCCLSLSDFIFLVTPDSGCAIADSCNSSLAFVFSPAQATPAHPCPTLCRALTVASLDTGASLLFLLSPSRAGRPARAGPQNARRPRLWGLLCLTSPTAGVRTTRVLESIYGLRPKLRCVWALLRRTVSTLGPGVYMARMTRTWQFKFTGNLKSASTTTA